MRALARVDLGAIERNCARLAAVAAPARLCAVVKADGYGHGAVPAARAAQAGGAPWLAVATAGEAYELRSAGIEGPMLVMGALSPAELDVALEARADVVAWREEFVASLPRAGRRARQARHRDGPAGHARPGRGLAGGARRRATGSPALMTHFATADEDDRGFLEEQLERVRGAGSPAIPACPCTPPTRPPTLREPAARFDMVRCGIAVYGMDPFHARPRRPRARAGARAGQLRRRGQARAAGGERRLRPPLRGRARDVARHHPDRLRRRRPPRAHQQRRRARRRPPRAAGGDGLDGQHHRRPRRRAGRARAPRRC